MDEKRCSTQFIINNYVKDEREFLLQKEVREEVCKYADVDLAIRGRYIPPKEVASTDSSRLLHFHLTGRSKQNLNMAIQKLELMLGKGSRIIEDDTALEEKITVGIDTFPSIFRIRDKILGDHNENVDYLTKETGAIITLGGKGSGCPDSKDEDLHLLVKYMDLESKPNTQTLVLNLIETVQRDFIESHGKYYPHPKKPEIFPVRKPEIKVKKKKLTPPPPKEPVKSTKNVTNDSGSHIEKITLGLKHVPIKFNLKSKIYGPNLSNVKHIEKVSSAVLLVEGVSTGADGGKVNPSESPHILVKYMKPELKDMARSLILNLIETIHQEFESLYGAYLEKPESPEILPIKSTSHFTKPSPPETATKQPCEKSSSPPARKHAKEDVRLDPRKNVDKPPPSKKPVPPPPPVISKPISPDYLSFANHSVEVIEKPFELEPLRSFSGPIESARASYPKADPIRPSYTEMNRPNTSYGMHNVKPIPSIVPPVSSQPPLLPTPAYIPQVSPYEELPGIQQLADIQLSQSDLQTLADIPLLGNSLPQYYKKRSISPVEMGLEPKKFCTLPPVTTPLPYLGNIESIDNINVPRPEPPRPKVTTANNRYLVELPKVSSTPAMAKGAAVAAAAKLPSPVQAPTPKKFTAWDAEQQRRLDQQNATHAWNPSPQTDPRTSANQLSGTKPKPNRWSEPVSNIDETTLPPRIPASWNPAASSAPWEVTPKPQINASKAPAAAKTARKPVSLKLRGPVKHQVNGKPVADGDAVMSFLEECAKSAAAKSKYDIFDESPDEETKSIILIDSDDEAFNEKSKSGKRMERMRSIAVQTDEGLRQTKVHCACGRFTKAVNDIRSIGVQTAPSRYGLNF